MIIFILMKGLTIDAKDVIGNTHIQGLSIKIIHLTKVTKMSSDIECSIITFARLEKNMRR